MSTQYKSENLLQAVRLANGYVSFLGVQSPLTDEQKTVIVKAFVEGFRVSKLVTSQKSLEGTDAMTSYVYNGQDKAQQSFENL